jgi:hypothetical protein
MSKEEDCTVGAEVGAAVGSVVGRAVVGLYVVGRNVGAALAWRLLSLLLSLLLIFEEVEGSGTAVRELIIAPTPGNAVATFAKSLDENVFIAPK